MTASVDYLPIWKKDSTAEEWLCELAAIARKHPERFSKAVIIYEEDCTKAITKTHYHCRNTSTTELMGLLELGKAEVLAHAKRPV